MADWIVGYFPHHRIYVEPFGGGASILLRKRRSYAEVYNDLDEEMVNLFRVVRDHGEELRRAIELTPFARSEFNLSFQRSINPIEQARRTVMRSQMGFGGTFTRPNRDGTPMKTGWRSCSGTNRTTIPAHDWGAFHTSITAITDRMRGVIIENRAAIDVMLQHDSSDTLHYVDPPYVHSTRQPTGGGRVEGYRFEMTDEQHRELAQTLTRLKGAVILSGYRCALYDELFGSWDRADKGTYADGARARVESIWMRNVHTGLFARPATA